MQANRKNLWLAADWPLQAVVSAGVSLTPHPQKPLGFNLALHVDDDAEAVRARRAALMAAIGTTAQPMWLSQVHGHHVVGHEEYAAGVEGDAAVSHAREWMAVVMTADCLPILLSDETGAAVAAIHAGWPGLHQGIIAKTVARMQRPAQDLYAWIGPGISAAHYEVDEPFYARFVEQDTENKAFFTPNREGHYWADLVGMAVRQLQNAGVPATSIYKSGLCSYGDARFFSHRRDRAQAGRMASFIVRR